MDTLFPATGRDSTLHASLNTYTMSSAPLQPRHLDRDHLAAARLTVHTVPHQGPPTFSSIGRVYP